MARQYDFAGQSGAVYRYNAMEEGRPLSPGGGNVVFVRMHKGEPKIVYCGESSSLYHGHRDRWDEAREQHGATDILYRLNVSGAVRRAEQADLVERHQPPMNLSEAA